MARSLHRRAAVLVSCLVAIVAGLLPIRHAEATATAAAAAAAAAAAGSATAAVGGGLSRRLQQQQHHHHHHHHHQGPGRKLLQPFTLAIQDVGDKTGRAKQRYIDRLSRTATDQALIRGNVDANSASVQPLSSFATTALFGGQTKNTIDSKTASDQGEAVTSAGSDSRAIGQPGVGIVATRNGLRAASLNQKLLDEGLNQPKDSTNPTYGVLVGGTVDYSAAGDYSFTGALGDYDYSYDYEYGQPRLIPETGVTTTATDTTANDDIGRSSGSGVTRGDASSPVATTRSRSTSVGTFGTTQNIQSGDIFGGSFVAPVNPFRTGGGDAAGIAIGRNYKFHEPATGSSLAGSTGVGSRNYVAGGTAGTFNYASGAKSATARSQGVSVTKDENINIDAGR